MSIYYSYIKTISSINRNEKGMTGIETAIILIAFVTVAAVFSYAVLGAGLFASEREKETLHMALDEVKSNLQLSGSVIVMADPGTGVVNTIRFCVTNAVAGNAMDMTPCDGTSNASNKCVISLATHSSYLNNVKWTVESVGATDSDNLLESGEQFEISIDVNDLGNGKSLSENIMSNDAFNMQVKPSLGSTMTIQRTLPPAIQAVMDLH